MKKTAIIMLPLLAVLFLTSCTGGNYDIRSAVSKEVIIYSTVVTEKCSYRETSEYEIVKKFKRLFAREIILPVDVNILRSSVIKMLVTQSCPTLFDPMDYSLPGSSVHGVLQARILE